MLRHFLLVRKDFRLRIGYRCIDGSLHRVCGDHSIFYLDESLRGKAQERVLQKKFVAGAASVKDIFERKIDVDLRFDREVCEKRVAIQKMIHNNVELLSVLV